jgi:hypothetical protein
VYSDVDNFRVHPGSNPQWQDSTWLQWWDLEANCGGVHRIGHAYNIPGGPSVNAWSNLITPHGIYERVTYLPLRAADTLEKGWGSGGDTSRNDFIDGENVWCINDAEADVVSRLVFKDYHPPFCGFPTQGRTIEDITSHHVDVSGSVTGTITMQGRTYQVNGMGLRDHGWGHRMIGTMLSHRYVTACLAPELLCCAYAIHNGVNDSIETFGWIVKGDTVVFAKDVNILVYAEIDSASTRGGRIVLKLVDGEVLDCELTAVAAGIVNVSAPTRSSSRRPCDIRTASHS